MHLSPFGPPVVFEPSSPSFVPPFSETRSATPTPNCVPLGMRLAGHRSHAKTPLALGSQRSLRCQDGEEWALAAAAQLSSLDSDAFVGATTCIMLCVRAKKGHDGEQLLAISYGSARDAQRRAVHNEGSVNFADTRHPAVFALSHCISHHLPNALRRHALGVDDASSPSLGRERSQVCS